MGWKQPAMEQVITQSSIAPVPPKTDFGKLSFIFFKFYFKLHNKFSSSLRVLLFQMPGSLV